MDRRTLLKLGAFTGGATLLPAALSFGRTGNPESKAAGLGYTELTLNDLDIYLFSDGYFTADHLQPLFAPGIEPDKVRHEMRGLYLSEDRLQGGINVMLIKKGEKRILIDTGSGYHFGKSGGVLMSNLERAGIKATDITDVFITHAHVDHIGGIIAQDGNLLYPKAQYHIARREYDFWMSEGPDFSKSKNTESPEGSIELAQTVLGSIRGRLAFFDYGEVLFSCLKTALAEGHTPGHTIFTVFSGDKSIKHVVDTFHSPLLIVRPEWGTQWDVDFEKAVQARREVLADCYEGRTLVMATHLPWPGLGHIGKKGADYQWLPLSYYTPDKIRV